MANCLGERNPMRFIFFIFVFSWCGFSYAQSHEFLLRFEIASQTLYFQEKKELPGKIRVQFAPPTLRESLLFKTTPSGRITQTEFIAPDTYELTVLATDPSSFSIQALWKLSLNSNQATLGSLEIPLASCVVPVIHRKLIQPPTCMVALINGDFPFMDALGRFCLEQTIGFAYQQKDFFYQRRGSSIHFLETIKKRQSEGFLVDVFTLTHGNDEVISSKPPITNTLIRETLADSKNLRIVYMIGCVNASLVDDWLAVGAKSALGHINNNYLPHLFFPFLFKFLGEGVPLHSAGLKAYTHAKETALQIATFASYENPESIQREIYDSTPFFAGENLNLYGEAFPSETNLKMELDARFSKIERKLHVHTPLETLIFDGIKRIVPYSNRNALNYLEGINPLFRDLLPAFWEIANQVLCEQSANRELNLRPEMLLPFFEILPQSLPLTPEMLAQVVQKITLKPIQQDQAQILFHIGDGKGWTYNLKPAEQTRTGELYQVRLSPKVSFDWVLQGNEKLSLQIQGLSVALNLPSFIPNDISLKGFELNFPRGTITFFARSTYTFVPIKVTWNIPEQTLEELEVAGVSLKEKVMVPEKVLEKK